MLPSVRVPRLGAVSVRPAVLLTPMTPERVVALLTVSAAVPDRVVGPLRVMGLLPAKVTAPLIVTALVGVTAALARSVPPPSVSGPGPRTELAPRTKLPPSRVVPVV